MEALTTVGEETALEELFGVSNLEIEYLICINFEGASWYILFVLNIFLFMPSDEDMAKLSTISISQNMPRVRKPLSPTAEPLVLAGVGFVFFLMLAFIFLRAPTVMQAEVAQNYSRKFGNTSGNFRHC